MLTRICLVMTLAAAGALAGCEKVKVSDEYLQEMSVEQVDEVAGRESVLLVDVRKAERYEQGHIAGAVNIYLPDIKPGDPRLGSAKQIIVYGEGWTDPLPAASAKRMLSAKYTNVHLFRGGLEVWQASDRPIVSSAGNAPTRPVTEP